MFGPALKIVRALLCALALTLIGVGSHALVRVESNGGETRAEWSAMKRAKTTPVIAARAGAACPLALAVASAATPRACRSASAIFVRFFPPTAGAATVARSLVEAERQRKPGARSGVVRLLI